ncbi:MAG: type II toxin-antitoxin system RelE/ParE family toxin [Gemmatimonadaceae bacterium]
MSLELRWTEQAANQLGAIAEFVSLTSPVYADQLVERLLDRLSQAQEFPESGRHVPEADHADIRERLPWATLTDEERRLPAKESYSVKDGASGASCLLRTSLSPFPTFRCRRSSATATPLA